MINLKSAEKAYIFPVEGVVTGLIPEWLTGSLYRIGPAKFEVGIYKYKHLFDGLGMVQRFWLHDGMVTFISQYVHSDTYMKNMIANRIVVSEFGTAAYPDPCQSIFKRFSTVFNSEMTDNTSVCVYPLGDELFSATETNIIHRINHEDLSTMGSIRLDKILTIHRCTAHQHIDIDTGIVHLLGFINNPPSYALITIPPIKREDSKDLFDKYDMETLVTDAKIVGKVNARWKFNPSYFHSFGITENYYILLECPLAMNVYSIMLNKLKEKSFEGCMNWWPDEKTIIHIINKKTGNPIPNTFISDAFFTFHHINAYEDSDHIVIDYCGYSNGNIIQSLYTESLQKKKVNLGSHGSARRLVVPLNVNVQEDQNENLVKLVNTTATAKIILKSGDNATIYCTQEELMDGTYLELPTINYNVYNGRKYRYIYGVTLNNLIKIDTVKKETIKWTSEVLKAEVGEAIFLPDPKADNNNPNDEDFGVLLFPVIYSDEEAEIKRYQSLLIVNAKTMLEIARAEFKSVSIPLTFHGIFLNNDGKLK